MTQAGIVPIGVTIIGGYLGTGKTTLINHLLRNAEGRRIAVLVNEFGELPIDAALIEGDTQEGFISLAGGCICCSYGSDLMDAMMQLPDLATPPEHVLIEASGVALPGAIAASVGLLPAFRVDGTVVLVDAQTVLERASDRYLADTITRQLGDADLIAVTRGDVVTRERAERVRDWLHGQAHGAAVVDAVRGQIPPTVLLGLRDDDIVPARAADYGHDTSIYRTRHWHPPRAVDVGALANALRAPESGLLRAKGFVYDSDGELVVVQMAGGQVEISSAPPGVTPGFVCIGVGSRMNTLSLDALLGSEGDRG